MKRRVWKVVVTYRPSRRALARTFLYLTSPTDDLSWIEAAVEASKVLAWKEGPRSPGGVVLSVVVTRESLPQEDVE